VVPVVVYGRRVRRLSRLAQDRIADTSAFAEESLNNVRTVQAFSHEARDRDSYTDYAEKAFKTAIDRTRARMSFQCSASLNSTLLRKPSRRAGVVLISRGIP